LHQHSTRFQRGSPFLYCFKEVQPTARSVYASISALSIQLIEAQTKRRFIELKQSCLFSRMPIKSQLGRGKIMKRILWLIIALLSLGATINSSAQSSNSQATKQSGGAEQRLRAVKRQVLISTEMPAARLEFDKDFKYAGGQRFILYDVAQAEQHFFVDADKQGHIKRMYWAQFEGYLPSNTHAYRYKANKTVAIGGLDFIADAGARNIKAGQDRPDSDSSRARAYLESKGLRMASDDVLSQRLVYMVDEAKRNELMIIYLEDMSGMGLTASDLGKGGRAESQWDEISKGLLERAIKGMKITR
jgi:hypothetical protein